MRRTSPAFATEQPADVTIDAIPGKIFKGHVTEVGELAILRTSGQASMTETTANTQEARDFKVVVTLDNPPDFACAPDFPRRPRFKRRRSKMC